MSKPSPVAIERLRTLYSIIAGIPEPRLDLERWINDGVEDFKTAATDCGTIACGVGWACLYPKFNREGLRVSPSDTPTFNGLLGWPAVEKFFDLTGHEARSLFSSPADSPYEPRTVLWADPNAFFSKTTRVGGRTMHQQRVSDKRLLLMRIRNFLHAQGVIDDARRSTLRSQEKMGTIAYKATKIKQLSHK